MFNVKFHPYSHPPIFHGKISGGEAEKKEKKNTLGLHKARQNQP